MKIFKTAQCSITCLGVLVTNWCGETLVEMWVYCVFCLQIRFWVQVEVVEGVAGEEDHHDEQEEHGEENAEAEGQHDEHDEDGMQVI